MVWKKVDEVPIMSLAFDTKNGEITENSYRGGGGQLNEGSNEHEMK